MGNVGVEAAELISGGLDGRFCHIAGKDLKPRFAHNFLTAPVNNAGVQQMINPPLVYDVCSSADGQLAGGMMQN